MHQIVRVLLFSSLLHSGLLAAATVTTPSTDRLNIRVEPRVITGSVTRTVQNNDVVYSGDRMELNVRLDRGAFIYTVLLRRDGSAAQLYPPLGQNDVWAPANTEIRVPAKGLDFQLDDEVGEEQIYIIASPQPLAQTDKDVAAALDQIRRTGRQGPATPPSQPRPAPGKTPSAGAGARAGLARKKNTEQPASREQAGGEPKKVGAPAQMAEPNSANISLPDDDYSWRSKGIRDIRTKGINLVSGQSSGVSQAQAAVGDVAIFAFKLQHRAPGGPR